MRRIANRNEGRERKRGKKMKRCKRDHEKFNADPNKGRFLRRTL